MLPVECHVGKPEDLERLAATVEAELGPVDILVNNSATNIGQGPSLETSTAMLIDKCQAIVSTGAEICTAVDSSCLLQIGGGLERQGAGVRTMHLAEILAS